MSYVKIGKIVTTHGIKGELRILSNFEYKNKVFVPGFKLYIGKDYIEEVINTYRPHKEFDMVTFQNYSNINDVLKYLKNDVYINKDDLNLTEEEYILEELVGYKVICENVDYGKVTEIVYNNSNVLLQVEGTKHFYIPNNENFIEKVNNENKEIYAKNIKGLIL